jgi:hypothetical protein
MFKHRLKISSPTICHNGRNTSIINDVELVKNLTFLAGVALTQDSSVPAEIGGGDETTKETITLGEFYLHGGLGG